MGRGGGWIVERGTTRLCTLGRPREHNCPPDTKQIDSDGSGVGSVQERFHGWDIEIRSCAPPIV